MLVLAYSQSFRSVQDCRSAFGFSSVIVSSLATGAGSELVVLFSVPVWLFSEIPLFSVGLDEFSEFGLIDSIIVDSRMILNSRRNDLRRGVVAVMRLAYISRSPNVAAGTLV
jgi:hypothetical protein